jgi:hypothetical protein
MFRKLWITGVLVLSVALMPSGVFAQQEGKEHGGTQAAGAQEHGGKEHAGAAAATAAPAASAAAVPQVTVTPPPLKPIVITFTGDLVSLDTAAAPPMITVQDRYGVKKEISIPAEAKISQGTQVKGLSDLKPGDKLTVEYTYEVATGKRTAQAITSGEATPAGP